MTVGMIWAQSTAGVIGYRGELPWRLPEDVAHFREATVGHPVIMGRRTWESLPDRFRPLPGRRNLVLSRSPRFDAPGAEVVESLDEAIRLASSAPVMSTQDSEYDVMWLIGGAAVFVAGAAGLASVAVVTEVDVDVGGDTFAPGLDGWRVESTGDWLVSRTGLRYRFTRYVR